MDREDQPGSAKPAPFTSRRLLYRPLGHEDLEDLQSLYGDPEVMRFIPPGRPRTLAETADRLERVLASYETYGFGLYAAVLRDSGAFAGRCGVIPIETPRGLVGDLAWMFKREFWGLGLAAECAPELIRHGFEDAGLRRLQAQAMPGNVASIKVMRRVGMRFAGATEERVLYELSAGPRAGA